MLKLGEPRITETVLSLVFWVRLFSSWMRIKLFLAAATYAQAATVFAQAEEAYAQAAAAYACKNSAQTCRSLG